MFFSSHRNKFAIFERNRMIAYFGTFYSISKYFFPFLKYLLYLPIETLVGLYLKEIDCLYEKKPFLL